MPRDYKTVFPDQKHLNVVFILLINAKIPTVVGILAFLSGKKIVGFSYRARVLTCISMFSCIYSTQQRVNTTKYTMRALL